MLKEGGGVNGPLESRYPVNDYLDVNLWSRGWRGREKASFVVAFTRRRTKLLGFFPTKRMVRKNGLFRQVLEKKVCQASKLYKVKRFCPQQIQPIFWESNGPFFASISHFLRTFFYFYLMTLSVKWINLSMLLLLQLPLIYYTFFREKYKHFPSLDIFVLHVLYVSTYTINHNHLYFHYLAKW